VLQARLADAEFYYREDTSKPISVMAGKLEEIVWMEGLGSLAGKAERIEKLSKWMISEWSEAGGKLEPVISRASKLVKADLASEMVKDGKEFTLLQGYIGREYAKASGEPDEVAEAIFEHYLPRFAEDRIPFGKAGIILSCADKLDNITGGFILDLQPTGSQDPYALRRQAMSVLRLMTEGGLRLSLKSAVEKSVFLFGSRALSTRGKDKADLKKEMMEFFTQRLTGILRSEGFDYDLVNAVLSADWEAPAAAREMVVELASMRREGALYDTVIAMKRIANIIPDGFLRKVKATPQKILSAFASQGGSGLPFKKRYFEDKAETLLMKSAVSVSKKIGVLEKRGEEHKIFRLLSEEFVPAVNRYFDDVLVNCEDAAIRENRVLFLSALHILFSRFCIFSEITVE
jgi:glycyl-tRNA synthetase beta chain